MSDHFERGTRDETGLGADADSNVAPSGAGRHLSAVRSAPDPMSVLDKDQLRRLLEAGQALVSEHELEHVLTRLLAAASELTGAGYAAIAVLDEQGEGLADHVAAGMDAEAHRTIGHLPGGSGLLGLLSKSPEPVWLPHLSMDGRAAGTRSGQPPTSTFLRVPIFIRAQAWGNLYLTNKQDGLEFDEADEASAVMLTRWAAIAVDSASQYRQGDRLRSALAQSVNRLGTTVERLEEDLRTSMAQLAASRARLVETAYAERRRIERDLHDGVQQDLVAVRVNLHVAAESIRDQPERSEQMIASLGKQMDVVLEELRSLARGIYPTLLSQRGLSEALKAAAHRSPLPVSVDIRGLHRYLQDLEVAVYFCCLEALQNFVKHAGHDAEATIRVREHENQLRFRVRDTGVGFDPHEVRAPHGLLNMQDRIDAVGGIVHVDSHPGRGTTVHGVVPIPSSIEAS